MSSPTEDVRLLPLEEDEDDIPTICSKKRVCFVTLVTFTILAVVAVIITVAIGWAQKLASEIPDPAYTLSSAINAENIGNHLYDLYIIANSSENGKSRSVLSGYKESADYIIQKLEEGAGCEILTQYFPTPIYTQHQLPTLKMIQPFPLEFQLNVDFSGLRYGGNHSGNVVNNTCNIPNYGCDPSDFVFVHEGCIALIQLKSEDDCTLIEKALNAQNALAGAVIIYNNQEKTTLITSRVRGDGWVENDPLMTIPVLAGTYSLGKLLTSGPVLLELFTNTTIEITTTFNVFCVTREGKEDSVIVAGAHLDSVPEGPGINDNGSGSATLLEIVLQWYALEMQPINKIRFAWWGSEEVGLIGSRYYVDQLIDDSSIDNIAMALNFDMLGSPNYIIGVHDGSTASQNHNGSIVITGMFEEYFIYMEKDYNLIPLVAGSDFVPFVKAGIPAGGLAAGAGNRKSEDERTRFGGLANAPYDSCYHQICDTNENIDYTVLADMSGAAAYVIQKAAEHENLKSYLLDPTNAFINERPTGSLGLAD